MDVGRYLMNEWTLLLIIYHPLFRIFIEFKRAQTSNISWTFFLNFFLKNPILNGLVLKIDKS
jgi:hypothetical protein